MFGCGVSPPPEGDRCGTDFQSVSPARRAAQKTDWKVGPTKSGPHLFSTGGRAMPFVTRSSRRGGDVEAAAFVGVTDSPDGRAHQISSSECSRSEPIAASPV